MKPEMQFRLKKLLRVLSVGSLTEEGVQIEVFNGRRTDEAKQQALELLSEAIAQGLVKKDRNVYSITEKGEDELRGTEYDRGHRTKY